VILQLKAEPPKTAAVRRSACRIARADLLQLMPIPPRRRDPRHHEAKFQPDLAKANFHDQGKHYYHDPIAGITPSSGLNAGSVCSSR
jgi:hypothetical protein